MNYKMVLNTLGKVFLLEGIMLVLPLFVGLIYQENSYLDYLIPIAILFFLGIILTYFIRAKDKSIYAKEGFVIVSLAWILMSVFGAIPFALNGAIPSYIDALFETVSGFTTTGSSVIPNVEILDKSILFWRSSTHWLGGMGVLVFVLAVTPGYNSGAMHVLRAESPGPTVGKLVSKLSFTARILYGIYLSMTVILVIVLLCGGLPVFDSVVTAFATAGTGGFGIKSDSIASYSSYVQIVIAVFMLLFSINFNLFYLVLIGNVKKALKSEEFRAYMIIIFVSTLAIALNILSSIGHFGEALKHAFFQVTSISSTTGFVSIDFNEWPIFSKAIIMILMIIGACAGSTGGGMKVSRVVILVKSVTADIKRMLHPKAVTPVKFENEPLSKDVERNVHSYFVFYIIIIVLCTLLLCLDKNEFLTNFSATLSCMGNIGPGFNLVGPMSNFAIYSPYSKVLLSMVMLIGRLEIFPIILLFTPSTWKKV
ncbi:MAG: TrkH family potassium uptake protein [Clostridia bacterium]|nr:TrkH family potassium uptake protein [Clostridia bacterium]